MIRAVHDPTITRRLVRLGCACVSFPGLHTVWEGVPWGGALTELPGLATGCMDALNTNHRVFAGCSEFM